MLVLAPPPCSRYLYYNLLRYKRRRKIRTAPSLFKTTSSPSHTAVTGSPKFSLPHLEVLYQWKAPSSTVNHLRFHVDRNLRCSRFILSSQPQMTIGVFDPEGVWAPSWLSHDCSMPRVDEGCPPPNALARFMAPICHLPAEERWQQPDAGADVYPLPNRYRVELCFAAENRKKRALPFFLSHCLDVPRGTIT